MTKEEILKVKETLKELEHLIRRNTEILLQHQVEAVQRVAEIEKSICGS